MFKGSVFFEIYFSCEAERFNFSFFISSIEFCKQRGIREQVKFNEFRQLQLKNIKQKAVFDFLYPTKLGVYENNIVSK